MTLNDLEWPFCVEICFICSFLTVPIFPLQHFQSPNRDVGLRMTVSRPRLQPCWILNIVLKCQRDSAPYTEACIRWEEQWTQHAIPQSMRCLYPCFAPDKKSIARDVPRSAVCTAADCRRQTYSLTCRRRQCQKPNHEKPNVQKADTAKRKERERNKSRVVAGKPREAV